MVRRVKSYSDLSNPEALKLLEDIVSKYGLTSPIVNVTLEYLRRFSKVNAEDAQELIKALTEKYGLAKVTAIQVINIMPASPEELQTIISAERKVFRDEVIKEIVDLLNSYRAKQAK